MVIGIATPLFDRVTTTPDLATLHPRDLLERLVQAAGAEPEPPEMQILFSAFYRRHQGYLLARVRQRLGVLADRCDDQQIVNQTFLRFLEQSQRPAFLRDLRKLPLECDRQIRAYLGRLAEWRVRDAFRKQPKGRVEIEPELIDAMPATSAPPPPDARQRERIERAEALYRQLRPVEQDVLNHSLCGLDGERKTLEFPHGTARRLAELHRTSPENIRKIKQLLMQRLTREMA